MMTDTHAIALVTFGFFGLVCWFVVIAADLVRIKLPAWIVNSFVFLGNIAITCFVVGLWLAVHAVGGS